MVEGKKWKLNTPPPAKLSQLIVRLKYDLNKKLSSINTKKLGGHDKVGFEKTLIKFGGHCISEPQFANASTGETLFKRAETIIYESSESIRLKLAYLSVARYHRGGKMINASHFETNFRVALLFRTRWSVRWCRTGKRRAAAWNSPHCGKCQWCNCRSA